jgi:uncharacterized surface protein with fasciclin (FAS1) repeats
MRRLRTGVALCAVTAAAVTAAAGPSVSAGARSERSAAQVGTGNDIVQTATAAGTFTTLTSLLKQAGLARTLEGTGPYTVFAPTDAAFAKVPKATLERLAKDRTKLRAVLLYHVASGKVVAADIAQRRSLKTLNGRRVRIQVRGDKVTVGGAQVVAADVAASNGVIHAINQVLVPR